MKLIAPMSGVMQWLKQLQAEGSPLVVERLKQKGHIDPAQPRLLDPRKGNVFIDPKVSEGGAISYYG